jgi:tRNA (guanine10-N2)-methyltransferase
MSYEGLHEYNRTHSTKLWDRYIEGTSFKFIINAYMHTIPKARQRDVVESFSYMNFKGKIDMTNPEIILTCFEECEKDFTKDFRILMLISIDGC